MKFSKDKAIMSLLIIGVLLFSSGVGHLIYAKLNFFESHELVKYSEFWSMYRSVASQNTSLTLGNNIFDPGNSSLNLKTVSNSLNITIYIEGISSVINPISPLIEDNWTKDIEGDPNSYKLFRNALENNPPQVESNTLQIYTKIHGMSRYYRIIDTFNSNTQRIYLKHLRLLYNVITERFVCDGISNGSRSYVEFSFDENNTASFEIWIKWNVYVTQRYGHSLMHKGDAPVLEIKIQRTENNSFVVNVIMKTYYAYISLFIPIPKQLWMDYILVSLGIVIVLVVTLFKLAKKKNLN
ncbi:MAG: hypothetical protein ACP6IS_08680 [Candidatus Asgardarchaeia archaeon]